MCIRDSPDAVAIAWDEKAPTFRHTAYDGYKATRHGMPQELAEQMPVSYTHLDVYKRQQQCCPSCHARRPHCSTWQRQTRFPVPVSYTHLDVYKRQALAPPLPLTPAPAAQAWCL